MSRVFKPKAKGTEASNIGPSNTTRDKSKIGVGDRGASGGITLGNKTVRDEGVTLVDDTPVKSKVKSRSKPQGLKRDEPTLLTLDEDEFWNPSITHSDDGALITGGNRGELIDDDDELAMS